MAASDARAQAVLTFLETIETIDSIAGIVDENGEKLGRLLKAIAKIDRKVDAMQKTLSTMDREASRAPGNSQSTSSDDPPDVFAPRSSENPTAPKEPERGRTLMSPIRLPRTPKRPTFPSSATTPRKHGAEDELNPEPKRPKGRTFPQALLFNTTPLDFGIVPREGPTRDASTRTNTVTQDNEESSAASSSVDNDDASQTHSTHSPTPAPASAELSRRAVLSSSVRLNLLLQASRAPHHSVHAPKLGSPLRLARSATSIEDEEEEEEEEEEEKEKEEEGEDQVDVPMTDNPTRVSTEESESDHGEI
ncbi:hypothetical protein F5Y08DRAFT_340367 [Xylaria arbuscula]|nr:hypothetical protein F5Y08DRAFT_340367 [Xylaria arbuscula]